MLNNIKDFIIDKENLSAGLKDRDKKKNIVSFTIVTENNCDFVVNKKAKTIDKTLVFMPSQELYYVLDNIKDVITPLTRSILKNIMTGFDLKFENNVWWNSIKVRADNIAMAMSIMEDDDIRRIIVSDHYHNCTRSVFKKNFIKNETITRYGWDKLNDDDDNIVIRTNHEIDEVITTALVFADLSDNNNAMYFIDNVMRLSIWFRTYNINGIIENIISGHTKNVNKTIDYLTHGFMAQGINTIDSYILETYLDDLRMQAMLHNGVIKEKYPSNLKTHHDIVVMAFNKCNSLTSDEKITFNNQYNEKYEYSDDKYVIISPKNGAEIVLEGIKNSNCVGSYVKRVALGKSIILFMRLKSNPDVSLITLEIKNNELIQQSGYANRNLVGEELMFLEQWCKNKNIIVNFSGTNLLELENYKKFLNKV